VTPFNNNWIADFLVASIGFTTNMLHISRHVMKGEDALLICEIPMWWAVVLFGVYFSKNVLILFFVKNLEAEKTRDSLTQILDNMPDAVLILEEGTLSYCN